MGRELQKKKNRSSVAKSKPKTNKRTKTGRRKVDFGGNEIIAKHWDRNLTLTQNYHRLGLSSRLEAASGGVEKRGRDKLKPKTADSLAIPTDRNTGKLAPEEVHVEKDPKTGRILRVIRPGPDEGPLYNPLNDPLNEIMDADTLVQDLETTTIISQLEKEAEEEGKRLEKKRPRQQSQGEEEWMQRLVNKHGDDFMAMARDRKLNPMQQTEGDIGRRIKKWMKRQAG